MRAVVRVRLDADILELSLADAPARFIVAMRRTAHAHPTFLGAGRGLDGRQALASCFGEAVEQAVARAAAMAPATTSCAIDLPSAALNANMVWNFSSRQLELGPQASERCSAASWPATLRLVTDCTAWRRTRTSDGAEGPFAPSAIVALSDDDPFSDSNGLAAGQTRADAERTALLELVERDAVAIWWYNRCPRPAVPLAAIDEAGGSALRRWLEQRSRRTHLLDLTHDLRVPVVAAVSFDQLGTNVAYGFAARMRPAEAAVSAALEMLQSELSLRLAAERETLVGTPEGPAGEYLVWSRSATVDRLPHLCAQADAPRVRPEPPGTDAVALLGRHFPGHVLFVDLDRPGDPLPVVRAIVPGLRHWRPRFAPGRLFDVPRALGWPHTPADEFDPDPDVILI